MFAPTFRPKLVLATIVLASMAPQLAGAQDPFALPGDLLLLKTRQSQLRHDRARLQEDIDRGDHDALVRDLHRVRRDERRIETDRWLLRSHLFLPLTFTTHPQPIPPVPDNPSLIAHPQYPGYGYFPSDPTHLYRLPQPASLLSAEASPGASPGRASAPASATAPLSVEIVNAGRPGEPVRCVIDGVAYTIEGGGRRKLTAGASSTIAYDRGGGLGEQRYSLSAGTYEFRPGDSGRAFFQVHP